MKRRRATTPEDSERLEAEVRKIVGHRGFMGPSLIEIIWEEMDRLVRTIKEIRYPMEHIEEVESLKNQALGLAYAIAVVQNPYSARLAREDAVNAVRRQAMERYYGDEED